MTVHAEYEQFLAAKQVVVPPSGFDPIVRMPKAIKPFQRDIVTWACRRGRAAVFAGTGLGKTLMELVWAANIAKHAQGSVLLLTPLAVAEQTVQEAEKFGIKGVAYAADASAIKTSIIVTNYDRRDKFGFTQRGCRLKCGFCVVPKKEGKPRSVNSIWGIWRGEPYPKHIHLLDNDFFGQPRESWEERIDEIKSGGFKVCLNQGVNIRTIDVDAAKALASIPFRDDQFKTRRLYTAWDSLGDESRFFAGVDLLQEYGVAPTSLLVYMLVGYDKRETWERVMYRFEKMTARGIRPYPMVYGDRERGLPLGGSNQRIGHRTLSEFQRWAIRKAYTFIPFEHYDVNAKGRGVPEQLNLLAAE